MSAINYLTLLSTIAVTSSGTPVPPGYINIASTNSAPTWSNSISTSGISGSTILVSSITTSTITVSTLGYSTISGSTINAQNITLSTLTVSSINSGAPGVAAYSTFNASSINATSTITTSTLTTTSNVGIGTASPVGNFHVYATSGPFINLGTAAYLSSLTMGIASGTGSFSSSAILNDVVIRATSTGSNMMLQTGSGASAIYINSSNNVGIGTANPGSKFVVYNSANSQFVVLNGEVDIVGSDVSGVSLCTIITSNNSGTSTYGNTTYGRLGRLTVNYNTAQGGTGQASFWRDWGIDKNGSLYFTTNQSTTQGITLTGTGSVGIGTSSPVSALTILNTSTGIVMLNSSANTATRAVSGGVVSNEICGLSSMTTNGAGSDAGQLRLSAGGGTNANTKAYIDLYGYDSNFISFGTNGTERMRIVSGGYIGIGTASPNASLQITNSSASGSGYGSLLVDSPNSGSAGGCITIRNSSGGLNGFCSLLFEVDGSTSCTAASTPAAFTQANAMIYCQSTNANNAGKLGFILWNGSGEVELMSIQPNGNILLNGATSNCSGINMPTAGYGLTWGPGYSRIFDDANLHICTDDIMYFHTGSNTSTAGTEAMVISSVAYVGIGTATPDAPLHIYKSVSRSYTSYGNTIGVQFAMTNSTGGRWYIGQDVNTSTNSNLYFIANVATNSFTTLDVCGVIENDTAGMRGMNFTGQHRCAYDSSINESTSEGLIVRATGTYWSLVDTYENTSPIDHITINESLPQITLVREANCPSVFGAVSFTEDTNSTRKHRAGRFTSVYANPFGEKKRVFVNALGEGGVWVCNINGNFTIGDLITTSTVPGYGMLQSSTQILNYTFGKITMDCNFQPALCPVQTVRTKQESKTTIEELFEDQITEEITTEIVFDEETQRYVQKTITKQTTKQVPLSDSFPLYDESGAVIGNHTVPRKGPKTIVSTVEDRDANGNVQWDPSLDANGVPLTKPAYQLRYLDADGTILTKDQYDARIQNGQPAYLAAFVGCIYQCG